jgi:quinol-cytochrome oxidoreductase complex cytochrome b subunit
LAGVLALFGGIVVLAVLPFITASTVQSSVFRPLYKVFY